MGKEKKREKKIRKSLTKWSKQANVLIATCNVTYFSVGPNATERMVIALAQWEFCERVKGDYDLFIFISLLVLGFLFLESDFHATKRIMCFDLFRMAILSHCGLTKCFENYNKALWHCIRSCIDETSQIALYNYSNEKKKKKKEHLFASWQKAKQSVRVRHTNNQVYVSARRRRKKKQTNSERIDRFNAAFWSVFMFIEWKKSVNIYKSNMWNWASECDSLAIVANTFHR